MYISYEHQLIQIGVPRTASVSACTALRQSDIVNPTDVFCSLPKHGNPELPHSRSALFDRHFSLFVKDLGLAGEKLFEYYASSFASKDYGEAEVGKLIGLKLPDWVKKCILLHHLTPTHLVRLGLLTEQQLTDFHTFGFVRDPLEKWVSGQFLIRHLAKANLPVLENITAFIRNGKFRNKHPIVESKMKNYFFHEGVQVATAYPYLDVESVVGDVIASKGGSRPDPFPRAGLLNVVPQEFREPIETWMPEDCVSALQEHYADDIAFYNSVVSV